MKKKKKMKPEEENARAENKPDENVKLIGGVISVSEK